MTPSLGTSWVAAVQAVSSNHESPLPLPSRASGSLCCSSGALLFHRHSVPPLVVLSVAFHFSGCSNRTGVATCLPTCRRDGQSILHPSAQGCSPEPAPSLRGILASALAFCKQQHVCAFICFDCFFLTYILDILPARCRAHWYGVASSPMLTPHRYCRLMSVRSVLLGY